VITNVVNFFLGTEHEKTVASLAKDPNGKAQLDGYVYEALRQSLLLNLLHHKLLTLRDTGLDPSFRGVFRKPSWNQYFNLIQCCGPGVAHKDQSVSGKECKQGACVFVDVHSANLDVCTTR